MFTLCEACAKEAALGHCTFTSSKLLYVILKHASQKIHVLWKTVAPSHRVTLGMGRSESTCTYLGVEDILKLPKWRWLMSLMLPSMWIMVLLHLWVGRNLYLIWKWGITRFYVPRKTTASCHKQTLEVGMYEPTCTYFPPRPRPQAPTWLVYDIQFKWITPTMTYWIIGDGDIHRKSSASIPSLFQPYDASPGSALRNGVAALDLSHHHSNESQTFDPCFWTHEVKGSILHGAL